MQLLRDHVKEKRHLKIFLNIIKWPLKNILEFYFDLASIEKML